MAYGEPSTKKLKHSIISDHIFEPEFRKIFCKNWHGKTAFKNSDIEIIAEPFRVCKISNFLKSEDFMDELKNELIDVKTRRNSIDLYQFEQSNDLVTADSNNIKTLYHTFQTHLSDWMQKNTKILLNDRITMTSSCYSDTDYLLCHDDNLSDRRIAFVLYLSKNWTEEDGGALNLFDTDEDGQPRNVVKSIIPEYNSLVMFEVVHNSYHEVAEVTSDEKSRWSINGWFHGPIRRPKKLQRPQPVINYVMPENIEVDLSLWISNNYLYPGIIKEIQEDVEQESFTFLSDFLKEDVYEILTEEVQSADIKWKRVGPADVRNYEVADEDSLPETLANFCRIFKSITIFELWKNYTELDLVPVTDAMNPRVTIELQRWSHGCYTLLNSRSNNEDNNAASEASSDKRPLAETSKCDYEAAEAGGESSSPPRTNRLSRLPNDYSEELEARESRRARRRTPPSSQGDADDSDDEEEEVVVKKRRRPRKKRSVAASQQMSQAKAERERANSDSDRDSDVSDIGDYLSDPLDTDQEDEVEDPGSLDVIMQFNTAQIEKETIDYVDSQQEDAALIHVPSKDNHICLVYKAVGTTRLQKYVNHYISGYFYNLICTYLE